MSEHTAGPWGSYTLKAESNQDIIAELIKCVQSGEGDFYFITEKTDEVMPTICHVGNGPKSKANAHLIAAAPDMLAALKSIVDIDQKKCIAMNEIENLIARAEGKS